MWTFGYPSNIEDGGKLIYCSGRAASLQGVAMDKVDCDMRRGASGGPVLLNFDSDEGVGTVISVHAAGSRAKKYAAFPRLGLAASQLLDDTRVLSNAG